MGAGVGRRADDVRCRPGEAVAVPDDAAAVSVRGPVGGLVGGPDAPSTDRPAARVVAGHGTGRSGGLVGAGSGYRYADREGPRGHPGAAPPSRGDGRNLNHLGHRDDGVHRDDRVRPGDRTGPIPDRAGAVTRSGTAVAAVRIQGFRTRAAAGPSVRVVHRGGCGPGSHAHRRAGRNRPSAASPRQVSARRARPATRPEEDVGGVPSRTVQPVRAPEGGSSGTCHRASLPRPPAHLAVASTTPLSADTSTSCRIVSAREYVPTGPDVT